MRETLGEKSSEAAKTVAWMTHMRRALGAHNQAMAEIHSTISEDVETDVSNPDFGRIKNQDTAHNMGLALDSRYYDGSISWIAEQDVDTRVAAEIQASVQMTEGTEAGLKARQDYLITQGYSEPIYERKMAISEDIRTRSVNPVAALSNIVKNRRAKKR